MHSDFRLLRDGSGLHLHQLGLRHASPALALLLLVALARPAWADPKVEAEAKELKRKAIEEDNLNVAYGEAIRKLSTALTLCKPASCAPRLRAEIMRDLGAMHFFDGSVEEGRIYFERAIALNSELALDRAYSVPAMEKLWADVKREAIAAAPDQSAPKAESSPASAGAASSSPGSPDAAGAECTSPADCPDGTCVSGKCEPGAPAKEAGALPPTRAPRFWIGAWGSFDVVIIPTANQACLQQPSGAPLNTVGYYCTDANGSNFPSGAAQNATLNTNPQYGDAVHGGAAIGNVRLGLSFDYALGDNLLLGVRVGGVLRGYPGSAAQSNGNGFPAPIHLEARGTYVIGARALESAFAPLVFVNAGAGEFDAAIPTNVVLTNNGKPQSGMVDAWAVGGPAFAGLGGGLRVLFQPHLALTVAAKFELSFGAPTPPLPTFGPEVTLAYGL